MTKHWKYTCILANIPISLQLSIYFDDSFSTIQCVFLLSSLARRVPWSLCGSGVITLSVIKKINRGSLTLKESILRNIFIMKILEFVGYFWSDVKTYVDIVSLCQRSTRASHKWKVVGYWKTLGFSTPRLDL